ncbi:globin domain-containing protein [Streptomyces lydicus]|uniref:globin domain-containing protein n=1 Tax=Streptomyces lydicus TaxID=47763 RepID=UPI0037CCD70D
MDAPTTTSADNGSSGGSSGDWGWFTPPAKKSSGEQQERQDGQDRPDEGGRTEPDGRGERDHNDRGDRDHRENRGDFGDRYAGNRPYGGNAPHDGNRPYGGNAPHGAGERGGRERIPSRPVNPIRPVGTAAAREREAEPPQAPQQHHETAPHPTAPSPAPAAPYAEQPATPYAEQSASPYAEQSATPYAEQPAAADPGYPDPFSPYTPPRSEAAPAREPARPSVWEREPVRGHEPEPVHEPARPGGAAPAAAPAPGPTQTSAPGPAPQAPAPGPAASAPAPAPQPPAPAPSRPDEVAAAPYFAAKQRPAVPAAEPSLEALHASAASAGSASPDALLIRRTMAEIEPVADKVTSYFYALLFVQHPDLRALFPAAMDAQRDRLFKALLTAAQHVDNAAVLKAYLANLGRGHRKYGTQPDHYPAVGECLLSALARYATSSWGPETEAAWVRAYTAISQIMIDAAAEDEAVAPAWWQAEVVSHELRTPDIAVVTVRPDQPYPFRAGQYTSVETPWWPRVWRHYSFASAPRSDGLLSFHVKAVPAGWVSNAMVHRARPGDVIRLGAPAGSMTVDHSTRNGLLCVGGGTGIAPIKALIEDVAEHGVRRPVDVFYGARTDHDLYDLDTMLRLEQTHQWLSVRPVVANGPAVRGGTSSETGQLPDAVRQYGPFREYDAYLSGPPGLIRSGVDALVGVGIPTDRIRHDSIEELVAAGD